MNGGKENEIFIGVFMTVTRRVNGYNRFLGKYLTGRRKRLDYIFLVRITSHVSPSV